MTQQQLARKHQGLAEARHKDKAEVHRDAAVMDWRRRGGNTLEEVWRSYRDTKPKAKRKKANNLTATFREFLDKAKAQKKATDMAVILNAETHRSGIQVVEEQKKAVDRVVNFNAENPHANTKVEVEAPSPEKDTSSPRKDTPCPREEHPGPMEAMERPRPNTLTPPWCATREPPRELPQAAELPRELTREIPKDAADVSVEQEILVTGIKVVELHEELPTKEFLKANKMSKELPTKEFPKTAKLLEELPKPAKHKVEDEAKNEAEAEYYDTCECTCLDPSVVRGYHQGGRQDVVGYLQDPQHH